MGDLTYSLIVSTRSLSKLVKGNMGLVRTFHFPNFCVEKLGLVISVWDNT